MDTCDMRIRVTPGQKAWLELMAAAEHRSVNGQVRALLEEAIEKQAIERPRRQGVTTFRKSRGNEANGRPREVFFFKKQGNER